MKKAFIQLHIAVFLAGFTAILGKLILLNEVLLVWYRLLLTTIILLVWYYFKKQLQKISLKNILKIFVTGGILAMHWVSFYGSIKYANVSVALVCFSATGFFTAILEPLILKQKISIIEIGLGLLAIVGIYIIFNFNPQYHAGIIFGITAALGSALFPIFNKQFVKTIEPKTVIFYEMSGGLLILTFIAPLYLLKFSTSNYLPTSSDWFWLFLLTVFCTIICFYLQLNALKKISAFTSNLIYNLEPIYGIALAFIFFNENKELNNTFYLGIGLILFAVFLQMALIYYTKKPIAKAIIKAT